MKKRPTLCDEIDTKRQKSNDNSHVLKIPINLKNKEGFYKTSYENSIHGDEDDMFSENFQPEPFRREEPKKLTGLKSTNETVHLSENYDDPDGYYRVNVGDELSKYKIISILGKGVFATVVRAKARDPINDCEIVAVKILRNNDVMLKAGLKELEMLKKVHGTESKGKRYIVECIDNFEYRNHLCIVFEAMDQNLRELLYSVGKTKGMNIEAVRIYARQLFMALACIRIANIIHSDIKPDNILVNREKTKIKLADFGSAGDLSENEITPYLVSRYYRAPEIILGLPYDFGIDVWSVACTLFELYTGSILFPGKTNNEMLMLFMKLKGRFPLKILKKGQFTEQHFEGEQFIDRSTKSNGIQFARKWLPDLKPEADMKSRLLSPLEKARIADTSQAAKTLRLVTDFCDFLEKCLCLNPEKRPKKEKESELTSYSSQLESDLNSKDGSLAYEEDLRGLLSVNDSKTKIVARLLPRVVLIINKKKDKGILLDCIMKLYTAFESLSEHSKDLSSCEFDYFVLSCDILQVSKMDKLHIIKKLIYARGKCKFGRAHLTFIQYCIEENEFELGWSVISDLYISDIEDSSISAKELLLYFYYCGILAAKLRKYERAIELFDDCICVTSKALSKVMVEAAKKRILVSLILHSKILPLRAHTNNLISRSLKKHLEQYLELADAMNLSPSKMEDVIKKNLALYNQDKNLGLVKLAYKAACQFKVVEVLKPYSIIKISDALSLTGFAKSDDMDHFLNEMVHYDYLN